MLCSALPNKRLLLFQPLEHPLQILKSILLTSTTELRMVLCQQNFKIKRLYPLLVLLLRLDLVDNQRFDLLLRVNPRIQSPKNLRHLAIKTIPRYFLTSLQMLLPKLIILLPKLRQRVQHLQNRVHVTSITDIVNSSQASTIKQLLLLLTLHQFTQRPVDIHIQVYLLDRLLSLLLLFYIHPQLSKMTRKQLVLHLSIAKITINRSSTLSRNSTQLHHQWMLSMLVVSDSVIVSPTTIELLTTATNITTSQTQP